MSLMPHTIIFAQSVVHRCLFYFFFCYLTIAIKSIQVCVLSVGFTTNLFFLYFIFNVSETRLINSYSETNSYKLSPLLSQFSPEFPPRNDQIFSKILENLVISGPNFREFLFPQPKLIIFSFFFQVCNKDTNKGAGRVSRLQFVNRISNMRSKKSTI